MKKNFIFFVLIILTQSLFSQAIFLNSGTITYEKKMGQINLYEYIYPKTKTSSFFTEIKSKHNKVVTDSYKLQFNSSRSYYLLEKDNPDKYIIDGSKPNETDFILQDIDFGICNAKKTFFEKVFVIKDSLKTFNWKFSNEVRDIAGFECKKAITKINDSVVVVAFYTDQIPLPSGPENFHGLPGMILGIAIPRLYLTIFATKIELANVAIHEPPILSEKKYTKWAKYDNEIYNILSKQGLEGVVLIWLFSL